jgi:hypothetical protein
MRFSGVITIVFFLALSVLVRAATFAQRNLPTFVTDAPQSISVSHLTEAPDATTAVPNPPVRKNSLLRNIDCPDLTPSLPIHQMTERTYDSPVKILVSAFLFRPVRPPSC